MAQNTKGRDENSLVTAAEAAECLAITARQLSGLVRRGVIRPVQKKLFHPADLKRVAEELRGTISVEEAYRRSTQAYLATRRVERKLDQVLRFMGARYKPLSINSADIETLYAKMAQLMKAPTDTLPFLEVDKWARTLFRMDEHYFEAVKEVISDDEPWVTPFDFGKHLLANAPQAKFHIDMNLAGAYGLLSYAQEHLLRVSYFWTRGVYGKEIASARFPDVRGNVNDTIMTLMAVHDE